MLQYVSVVAGLLCGKVFVLGDTIKETPFRNIQIFHSPPTQFIYVFRVNLRRVYVIF
jgi:hypothetical protein